MSRRKSLLQAAGIFALFVLAAVLMVRLRPDPPVRLPESSAPWVSASPVRAGSGPIIVHGAGTVRPRAEIEVAAEISGKVARVNPAFQSGGRVPRGATLFQIEDTNFQNRVKQARASVAAQQVALLQATAEARVAHEEFEQFRRRSGGEGAVEGSPLTLREPQLAAARAALARDSAVLADAELALARTRVLAPFGGIVRQENVDAGRFVAAGQPVGRLYADDAAEVVVPLSDADAALLPRLWELRAGDNNARVPARVTASYGDTRHAWEAYVDRAEPALDEQTRTIRVVVRVPDPFRARPPLLIDQFVDVEIEGSAPGPWFVIPRSALRPDNEVWAVQSDSLLAIVPVDVFQRTDEIAVVSGALQPGQRVVTGGISLATEGMVVRVLAEGAQGDADRAR